MYVCMYCGDKAQVKTAHPLSLFSAFLRISSEGTPPSGTVGCGPAASFSAYGGNGGNGGDDDDEDGQTRHLGLFSTGPLPEAGRSLKQGEPGQSLPRSGLHVPETRIAPVYM
jgi:hypothetical protein